MDVFSSLETLWMRVLNHSSPYQGMLLDFLEVQAQRLAESLPKLKTREEWDNRRTIVRENLLCSLGLTNPPDKNPLNPKVTGRIERGAYHIEKIVFEPRPGFLTSAHLYLPKHCEMPAPAVLYSPGHWIENGKLEPDLQLCCANLACLGFVVLIYDPIGQGERFGSWNDHGHLAPLLVGLSQEGLMVWESMRAIDYLIHRPEVDPTRIGMTGASGGGLNTIYTSALDDRIQASIPVCFVTSFLRMMTAERDRNWEDGVDLCNQVPGVMAYAEMSDICGLFAPKPLCIIAGKRDWMFPIEGTRQVFQEISKIYSLFDASSNIRLVETDAEHGYSKEMREAAYGWLTCWFQGHGQGSPILEEPCDLLPHPYPISLTYMAPPVLDDLPTLRNRSAYPASSEGLCFPGETPMAPGPAIIGLTKDIAHNLPSEEKPPSNPLTWKAQRLKIIDRLRHVLGPFPTSAPVKDRIYNQIFSRHYFAERVVFESEPGIFIPCIFMAPIHWTDCVPVVIYVDEWGKDIGLNSGLMRKLLEEKIAVLAIDVRGTGETAASDFEASTNALMTDRPLFGQRVWDIVRAVDALWQRTFISIQIDKGRIGCMGRGSAGLLALTAGALDERLSAIGLWESPLTYHSLIQEEKTFPASLYLFNVLKYYDLPQLMSLIAPRPLFLVNPIDGTRAYLHEKEVSLICQWPCQIYSVLESADQFSRASSLEDTHEVARSIANFFSGKL